MERNPRMTAVAGCLLLVVASDAVAASAVADRRAAVESTAAAVTEAAQRVAFEVAGGEEIGGTVSVLGVLGGDELDDFLAVDAGASDAHRSHGYKWALRTAQMLAEHDVAWFEEALPPDDVRGYAELRRRSLVPIAGGEVLTRRQEFARYLESGAFDIVQPDTTKGGGLSESRRIGWTAEQFGARLIPHGWNTAVGLVADLHLASALALTDLVEYRTGSPYIDDLVVPGFHLDVDGMLPIPDGPGLGVRLDLDAVARWGTGDLGLPDG